MNIREIWAVVFGFCRDILFHPWALFYYGIIAVIILIAYGMMELLEEVDPEYFKMLFVIFVVALIADRIFIVFGKWIFRKMGS